MYDYLMSTKLRSKHIKVFSSRNGCAAFMGWQEVSVGKWKYWVPQQNLSRTVCELWGMEKWPSFVSCFVFILKDSQQNNKN